MATANTNSSFLRPADLLFYEKYDVTENADGTQLIESTLASDAQIGGLAAVPRGENFACSKAYVDSVASSIAPHEGVDFHSLATNFASLIGNDGATLSVRYSDGARRTASATASSEAVIPQKVRVKACASR